jgi:hypothetical protein
MKGALLAAVLACAAPAAAGAAAPAASARPMTLEPPSGWHDVTAETKVAGLVLALKGPASSSFALARMPESAMDNPAATRAYLGRVLAGIRAGSGLDFRAASRVESKVFRNGVTARFVRVNLKGRPALLIGVVEAAGSPPLTATLASAVPDAMMDSLFGALKVLTPAPTAKSGVARSLDGQLELTLGGGLVSRPPTGPEMQEGVVFVIGDGASETVFLKLPDNDSPPTDEPRLVRATVADAIKIPLASVGPAFSVPTPAGPAAVCAWSEIPGVPGQRFAAAYLPWSYWGYSVLARGPQADELMKGVLSEIQQGPSAVAKLVATSPVIEIPAPGADRRLVLMSLAGVAALVLLVAAVWSRGRKKANLPS